MKFKARVLNVFSFTELRSLHLIESGSYLHLLSTNWSMVWKIIKRCEQKGAERADRCRTIEDEEAALVHGRLSGNYVTSSAAGNRWRRPPLRPPSAVSPVTSLVSRLSSPDHPFSILSVTADSIFIYYFSIAKFALKEVPEWRSFINRNIAIEIVILLAWSRLPFRQVYCTSAINLRILNSFPETLEVG